MVKVGDKIKIISLYEEPQNSYYNGKEGIVERFETDPWGERRMSGTWGSIFIYVDKDIFEII